MRKNKINMEANLSSTNNSLLHVQGLKIDFWTEAGNLQAVRGIDFLLKKGDVLGIVGESGCGKSATARAILRIIPTPPGCVREGKIVFKGQDLLGLSLKKMRKIRGKRISMIFQEPMSSLNPSYTIGDQIMEAILLHQETNKKSARRIAIAMLNKVGISDPDLRMDCYPFQLSGGMRQRVMIAIALSCQPDLLIADEPTTALDVTIQAQIMDLLEKLQAELGMSMIIITHNLALIKDISSHIAIMYAGKIVEFARTREVFEKPLHPYTQGLFACIPKLTTKTDLLNTIPGKLPNPIRPPAGCSFYSRCLQATDICAHTNPPPVDVSSNHNVSCHLYGPNGAL
jgi:oligopeptide/dipeptide ABC transporter ATP-binding protein